MARATTGGTCAGGAAGGGAGRVESCRLGGRSVANEGVYTALWWAALVSALATRWGRVCAVGGCAFGRVILVVFWFGAFVAVGGDTSGGGRGGDGGRTVGGGC